MTPSQGYGTYTLTIVLCGNRNDRGDDNHHIDFKEAGFYERPQCIPFSRTTKQDIILQCSMGSEFSITSEDSLISAFHL